jgi:hypothetical protein
VPKKNRYSFFSKLNNSEESIQFYTGLQNYESFKALYESLVDFGIDSVKETRGPKAKLRLVDEFLMVLMRQTTAPVVLIPTSALKVLCDL